MSKSRPNKFLNSDQKLISLFYWSEIEFMSRTKENYGDLLSKYLVEKISGKKVNWVHPKTQPWYKLNKKNFLAIGSIIHHSTKDSIVWGSGIIDQKQKIADADFRAVRGPRTRDYLLNLGYKCPPVYGDPGILLPKYFFPEVEQKYRIGIIPHYSDFQIAKSLFKDLDDIIIIDLLTLNIEEVTREILSCEKIISSSLHGIVVAHSYDIPGIWVEFSDKIFGDGIKYMDYLESIGLGLYKPELLSERYGEEKIENLFEKYPSLPEKERIQELQRELLRVCPFNPNLGV